MKHILLTGGAGYIGTHLALAISDRPVVILDNLSTSSRRLLPKEPHITFEEGDVGNLKLVRRLIEKYGIEEIIHLAAFVDVAESMRDKEKYRLNNLENTKQLLKAAKYAGVKRFVFSSTAAVYGTPEKTPVGETAATNPESPYGEYKLAAEKEIKKSDLQFAILRYFNVAGVDSDLRAGYVLKDNPTHLIRRAVLMAASNKGELFEIFGNDYPTPDGTCVRDFVHVSDLSHAHVRALQYLRGGGPSKIFNVGTGKGYSVQEVLQVVRNVCDSRLEWRVSRRRPGDVANVVADVSRIKKSLDWESRLSLPNMVRDEWRWMKAQAAR